jgi:hypothetical protein
MLCNEMVVFGGTFKPNGDGRHYEIFCSQNVRDEDVCSGAVIQHAVCGGIPEIIFHNTHV